MLRHPYAKDCLDSLLSTAFKLEWSLFLIYMWKKLTFSLQKDNFEPVNRLFSIPIHSAGMQVSLFARHQIILMILNYPLGHVAMANVDAHKTTMIFWEYVTYLYSTWTYNFEISAIICKIFLLILQINNTIKMLYFPNDQLRYCGYIPFHRISSKLAEYKDWLNWGKFVVFENMTRVGNTFVILLFTGKSLWKIN